MDKRWQASERRQIAPQPGRQAKAAREQLSERTWTLAPWPVRPGQGAAEHESERT